MRIKAALAAGLALTAIALAILLSHSPPTLAGTNGVPNETGWPITHAGASVCQANEVLPRGTTAIRLLLGSLVGPQVSVQAFSGTQVIAHGTLSPGWVGNATVSVAPVPRSGTPVKICFKLGPPGTNVESFRTEIFGEHTRPAIAAVNGGEATPGRARIEYLRAGNKSWWSLASTVARHMGLGHAWSGTWIVLLMLALMGAVGVLSSWLITRELQ
jgi:hypothetical protein